jgi:hypothetical protein
MNNETRSAKKPPSQKERNFQAAVIRSLREIFPGAIVLKNDASYLQGVPDVLVLHDDRWGALECKVDQGASFQPNQEYYVEKMNDMSFAAVIHPGNKDKVFDALQRTFGTRRTARVPRAK